MTPTPIRVQRQRTKGWRMPENTVYVGRGTKWGNPWKVGHLFSLTSGDPAKIDSQLRAPIEEYMGGPISPETAVELYRLILPWRTSDASTAVRNLPFESAVKELAGKNLACWCPLAQPCHADVLLEVANA